MTGKYLHLLDTYYTGVVFILHFSIYLTILNLPRGEHYYRYIVDGKGNDTNVIRTQNRPF